MSEDLEPAIGEVLRSPRTLIRASINGYAQKELKIPVTLPPGLETWKERLEKLSEAGGQMTEKEFGEVMKTLSAYHTESKEATAKLQELFHALKERVSLLDQSLESRKEELKTLAKAVGDLAPLVRDIPDLKTAIDGLSVLAELKDDVDALQACEKDRTDSRKTFKQQVRNSAISWAVPIACAVALAVVGIILTRAVNSLSDIRNVPQAQAARQEAVSDDARKKDMEAVVKQAVQETTRQILELQQTKGNRYAGKHQSKPEPVQGPGGPGALLREGELHANEPWNTYASMRYLSAGERP